MSNTIDILTVVDCVSIMNAVASGKIAKGTQANPSSLGANTDSDAFIYMITASQFVVNNEAKSELTVKADVGDTVRWMVTCPGVGTSYNPYLTNWAAGSGGTFITPPISFALDINLFVGSGTVAPVAIPFKNFCYSGTVVEQGTVQYVITFGIVDESGQDLGFYIWDPFIAISN